MNYFGERFYPKDHVEYIRPDLTLIDDRNFRFGHITNNKDTLVFSDNFLHWKGADLSQAYYPRYLFEILANPETQIYDILEERPYFLSCLNRVPRYYRCKMLLALLEQPWISHTQYSFACLSSADKYLATDQIEELVKTLTPEEFQTITQLLGTCVPGDNSTDGWGYTTNASVAHKNCYVDLVTESNLTYHQITEKTWKPILSGQLFLILGATGIIQHLKETGIDVFDDIIDHSYDNESDVNLRIRMIIQSLNELEKNIETVWNDTYHRRINNLNLIKSIEYQNLLLEDIRLKCS